jgi:hypothetical protein
MAAFVIGQSGKWVCTKHGPFADITQDGNGIDMPFVRCPVCDDIRSNDLCRECEKHSATINFSSSTMDYIHGGVERICRCCYVKRVEKHFAEVTATLAKAKNNLIEHPCDPFEPESL